MAQFSVLAAQSSKHFDDRLAIASEVSVSAARAWMEEGKGEDETMRLLSLANGVAEE